ncbi:uncharacterized protein LOC124706553 [Lolium rigidum]|uniref:uncharacterized protein LOC124706553 n=1 Tax=Lolium rigidum TaxID=89674 RepID=UPI001F5C33C3|nr:uncharacterized protein LOC124706553 [Lolium rigidum]
MGTEVLRSHDCLSRVRHHARGSRRSPRPAARTTRHGAARHGQAAAAASPVPREVRVKAAAEAAYAGPAFGAMSPSPRALPLPRFSFSKPPPAAAAVDDSATRELRRLLGLERPETN